MDKTIQVDSVTRRFGEITAVHNLSFDVATGEIFGLLGPNGAGKTTTIHLIIGMLSKDGGSIQVLGLDPHVQTRQVHSKIGYIPQETNVYMDLSAVDNLWHHAALYCQDLSLVEARIEELLKWMNLWDRRKDPVRTYSGGMKRRLALARTLLHDPQVILFDEPSLGVDVQGKHVLWETIQDQQARGKTVIISTNDMMEADCLCDRLVIIDHGEAIALDTPETLKAALGRDIVTLHTTPTIENPEALFEDLKIQAVKRLEPGVLRFEIKDAETKVEEIIIRVRLDHHLESMRIARPSLDDVFLHHTGRALRD
ncbi:MAG: ABC transporter ATP-binding protein [Anaerolineales bacterium]